MSRYILVFLVGLIAVTFVTAQGWQYDEDNEVYQNCDLIDVLKEAYGDEDIMKFADSDMMTLAFFLDRLFAVCAEWNRGDASNTFDDSWAEPETELEVSAVLEDREAYSIDAADCSVMAQDRFDEDLNVTVAGAIQEDLAVEVYLPGTSQALDMPNVNTSETEILGVTVPTRVEWAVGRNFPLGRYTFDVTIEDDSYRFQWLRRNRAVNTIVVTCVDPAVEEAFADELTAETDDG